MHDTVLHCTIVQHGVTETIPTLNKKAVLSQRWPRNAPHIWVPWKFSGLPDYAHGYFSQNFSWAIVLIHPVNERKKI